MIKNYSINLFSFSFKNCMVFSQNVETMKSVARFSSDAELHFILIKQNSIGLSLIEVEELVKLKVTLSEL